MRQVSALRGKKVIVAVEELPEESAAIIDIWTSGKCRASFRVPFDSFDVRSSTLLDMIITSVIA